MTALPAVRGRWTVSILFALLIGCGPTTGNTDLRVFTDDIAFRISTEPSPPLALERTRYKVVARDKKTGEPIESGQGRVFATSVDGANTWDGLAKGRELGTYYATLTFVTAGQWKVGLQFRRDSTKALTRAEDWSQDVHTPADPGS